MASEKLLTRAEATDYQETSRHSDVVAFVDALVARTPLVTKVSLGTSGEGQDMVAMVLGGPDPRTARKRKKAVVMVEANIHAGEVEGKEMVLALARDLTVGPLKALGKKLLEKLCLVLIPDFNPDGNDRISPKNRALDLAQLEGQVNPPGGVGMRYTGEGWNLNRDNMKQEAVETRNLARFYQEWWPEVFIDCHTTDGSLHAFDLTYDTSHGNEALFGELRQWNRKFLDRVAKQVEKRHDFRSFWYGNYVVEDQPSSGWHTYPALPRFGSHYRGLLGRVDVLLETYSYISFERRCQVMRAWLLELFRASAQQSDELRAVTQAEAERILRRGEGTDPRERVGINYGVARRDAGGALVFDYPAYALDGDEATIVAYDEASLKARKYPGEKEKKYRAPHHRTFVPTHEVSTPVAYVVPAALGPRLAGHGLAFQPLPADTELVVDSYRIVAREQTFSPDVAAAVPPPGEAEVPLSAKPPPKRFETVLTVAPERRRVSFAAGTLVVPTAQRAGTLAVYLLEPHADDGLARWQYLDAMLEVGGWYPIHRVVEAPEPLKTKTE